MAEIFPESKSDEGRDGEITLRRIVLSDIDDFMVWATDARVSHFCVWDTYTSKHQAFQFINDVAIPHPWFRVICINNRAVGSITVTPSSEKPSGTGPNLSPASSPPSPRVPLIPQPIPPSLAPESDLVPTLTPPGMRPTLIPSAAETAHSVFRSLMAAAFGVYFLKFY